MRVCKCRWEGAHREEEIRAREKQWTAKVLHPRRKVEPGFRKGCAHGGLIYDHRKRLAVKPLHLMAGRLETRQGLVRDLKRGRKFGPVIRGLGRVGIIKHQEKSA